MCHFIQSKHEKNYFGFALQGFLFLGVKKFKIQDNKLKSYYEEFFYSAKIDEDGIYIEDGIKKQNIIFDIPVYDPETGKIGNFPLIKVIDAGLHVSPFNGAFERLPYLEFYSEGIVLPVAFLVNDIIFFDGENISVKSFTILKPDHLKEIFSESLKKFNWNLYEEIFDKLTKLLNGSKIEIFK